MKVFVSRATLTPKLTHMSRGKESADDGVDVVYLSVLEMKRTEADSTQMRHEQGFRFHAWNNRVGLIATFVGSCLQYINVCDIRQHYTKRVLDGHSAPPTKLRA